MSDRVDAIVNELLLEGGSLCSRLIDHVIFDHLHQVAMNTACAWSFSAPLFFVTIWRGLLSNPPMIFFLQPNSVHFSSSGDTDGAAFRFVCASLRSFVRPSAVGESATRRTQPKHDSNKWRPLSPAQGIRQPPSSNRPYQSMARKK